MINKTHRAKRKPIQCFAFIDTNIFLDFYRKKTENTFSLLKKLEKVSDRIICTYQVEMEFLKNRQSEIRKIMADTSLGFDAQLPAVLSESSLEKTLKKRKKELDSSQKTIEKKVINLLNNPSKFDPIYSSLESIFKSESAHVLTRDMPERKLIKNRALKRFLQGYPPRKNNDTSYGDALNWEWILHCASNLTGKFIIVTRDSDFGISFKNESYINDSLKQEFRERVGRKPIYLTNKLSTALKFLEVHVSKEEEENENLELEGDNHISNRLQNLQFENNQFTRILKIAKLVDEIYPKDLRSLDDKIATYRKKYPSASIARLASDLQSDDD